MSETNAVEVRNLVKEFKTSFRRRPIRAVAGVVRAAPSKSVTHRALVAAALASGRSTIARPLEADDTRVPKTWLFHHRWGKTDGATTGKGEAIAFDTIGGRTTAWVPDRQS